jgi:hypothetical protein
MVVRFGNRYDFGNFPKKYSFVKRMPIFQTYIFTELDIKTKQILTHKWQGRSQTFIPIQDGQKQGRALSPLLFNFALEYAITKIKKTWRDRY